MDNMITLTASEYHAIDADLNEAAAKCARLTKERDELREALTAVLAECLVPAPGPGWRWADEYYIAFDLARKALANTEPS